MSAFRLLRHLVVDADGEGALFRIAELHLIHGSERHVEIEHAVGRLRVEGHAPVFLQQGFPVRVLPVEVRFDDTGLIATLHTADFVENDLAVLRCEFRVRPEVEAVHIAVSEPDALVVRVVLCLACDLFHWIAAGDDGAVCRPKRVEVRFIRVGTEEKGGEWLAVNLDVDPVGLFGQLHVGPDGQGKRR